MNTTKTNGVGEHGRSRVIPPEARVILRGLHPGLRTLRGRQELWYRLQAVSALRHDEEFRWLVDWDRMLAGDDSAWQPTVVSELGRLHNPELIRCVARVLCARRPNTQTAVTFIRRAIVMLENPGDAAALATVIGAAIGRYRKAHPGTSFDQIAEALSMQCKEVATLQERAGRAATMGDRESRNAGEV